MLTSWRLGINIGRPWSLQSLRYTSHVLTDDPPLTHDSKSAACNYPLDRIEDALDEWKRYSQQGNQALYGLERESERLRLLIETTLSEVKQSKVDQSQQSSNKQVTSISLIQHGAYV